ILPEDVDKQKIGANVENGVLRITLPKLTPEQKQETLQQIEVK
ncbi:MAG: Hsp20 family protein, partial [Alloprevotella tannerae]|nr:Hsp20 family protein [Alloprevotella tannerae]